ncbi:hypothetical protein Ahy_A06g030482 isoform B [Arachis hypogaea]|nr:hypothetical protein Ahy_A06g030482 isoform B [Arachis hypogaea]
MATECLDMFHGIDRTAFKMLTQVLHREVTQSLMVNTFLLSLKSMGLSGIMQNATKKGSWFMNSLAEDYVIYLKCLLSPVLSGVVEKSKKLETFGHTLRTEVTVSQVHGMRSVLQTIIPDTLSNVCSRILGDVTMDAVWLDYHRNPARILGCNTGRGQICCTRGIEWTLHCPTNAYATRRKTNSTRKGKAKVCLQGAGRRGASKDTDHLLWSRVYAHCGSHC